MTRRQREREEFKTRIREFLQNDQVQKMREFSQHGTTNTLDHSIGVARMSFWISKRLPFRFRTQSMLKGAILHDFYLYDWHKPEEGQPLHGFRHPATALRNAKMHFTLNSIEENVIASHMWPLTLRKVPHCREAALVCIADKVCSVQETVGGLYGNKRKELRKS